VHSPALCMACHSDTQDTLLGVSPQGPGGDMGTYADTSSGCGGAVPADYYEGWLLLSPGLWVTNSARLRSIIELVARACFQRRREPMDAALWYASISRSLLPYNRSLLTLTHTSGMPVLVPVLVAPVCLCSRALFSCTRSLLTLAHTSMRRSGMPLLATLVHVCTTSLVVI